MGVNYARSIAAGPNRITPRGVIYSIRAFLTAYGGDESERCKNERITYTMGAYIYRLTDADV